MSSKQTTRSGRSVKPTKRMIEEPELDSSSVSTSSQESNVKQETTNTRSKSQVKKIQSNTNSRSGRSIKPTKRMIEEPDLDSSSLSKSSQESKVKKKITNTKGKCQVKEVQSKMNTKRVTRRTTKKSKDEEFSSSTNSTTVVQKTNVEESSVNALSNVQDKKHVPIYMRKEKVSAKAEQSFVNMAPDPYEELDYLELDDENYFEKNKKKVRGKGANPKKRKPKKTKAELILMFGSSKKDKDAHQAVKQLKNLQTPSQDSKRKQQCEIPKIAIEGTKEDSEVFENIQLEEMPSPPHEDDTSNPTVTFTAPTPPFTDKIRNETPKTPIIRSKFVPERKASTPKVATISHPPTKQELMKNCFGFDDSSTEDEEKPKNDSLSYSPMQNVRSSFIQMTPAPQPPRGRNVSGSSTTSIISGPMRFDFKLPGQKPQVKSRSKYVNKPIKPLKQVLKPESSTNEQNEVSLFDDPLDKNCNDEMEDLNAFEVLGKASKTTKVAAKKPLKTITNTGNTSKSTTQSLVYEKADNGQKQLRSKRKAITISDDSENETESRNVSKTYERADALNCSISAYESPKKVRKTKKVSGIFLWMST